MIHARHPGIAARIIRELDGQPNGHSLRAAVEVAHRLAGVRGFEVPSWTALLAGLRPPPWDQEDEYPIRDKSGWQHEAASRIEQEHRESLFRVLAAPERALLRSQGGPGAGAAFPRVSDMPSHSDRPCTLPCFAVAASASPSAPFRALLPVWPSTRFWWSPPSRMRKGGGFGKTRIRGGKRSSKDLSRGRRTCHHKRDDPRYGPGGTKSCRCSSAGDRR